MPRSAASVAPKKAVLDTQDHQIGQPSMVTVDPIVVTDTAVQGGAVHETKPAAVDGPTSYAPVSGPLLKPDKDEEHYLEGIEGPAAMSRANELAFNEELVKIVVHDSTNPNEENPVQVASSGRRVFIWRGQETLVRRKYVERLARAKITAVGQKRAVDAEGNNSYSYPKTSALKYPFSVVEDINPKGRDWLRKILSEPA